MTTKAKRFRLSFIGPIEDQPRLIRAYGRACHGEFALVMRPGEARGVLVLITPKDGAFVWKTGDHPAPNSTRATVLRDGVTRLRLLSGPSAGEVVSPKEGLPSQFRHGEEIDVSVDESGKASGWIGGDAPRRPATPISPTEAVKLVKAEQKNVPDAGPTTLRGRWTGFLYCDEGKPRVELHRKLAAYGTLSVTSSAEGGWSWRFERTSRWFGEDGVSSGDGLATLSQAMEAGVLGAMSLVREACSFRDTRRRAAHDGEYARKYPIKAPMPMRDPTERLKVKASRVRAPVKKKEVAKVPKSEVPRETSAKKGQTKPREREVEAKSLRRKPRTKPMTNGSKSPQRQTKKRTTAGRQSTQPDAEKDKALVDAFSAAIAVAMAEQAA
jgi:hypothetical protein